MNVLVVKNRFEAPILDDSKDTSIRPHRKDGKPRAKPGQALSIRVWTGRPYRSKQREICRRIVKFVFPVRITSKAIHRPDIKSNLSREKVARADGFSCWLEMRNWFRAMHGLPFGLQAGPISSLGQHRHPTAQRQDQETARPMVTHVERYAGDPGDFLGLQASPGPAGPRDTEHGWKVSDLQGADRHAAALSCVNVDTSVGQKDVDLPAPGDSFKGDLDHFAVAWFARRQFVRTKIERFAFGRPFLMQAVEPALGVVLRFLPAQLLMFMRLTAGVAS